MTYIYRTAVAFAIVAAFAATAPAQARVAGDGAAGRCISKTLDQTMVVPGVIPVGDNSLCWDWCRNVCDGYGVCWVQCFTRCAPGDNGDPRR
jgi:hypothetical protein